MSDKNPIYRFLSEWPVGKPSKLTIIRGKIGLSLKLCRLKQADQHMSQVNFFRELEVLLENLLQDINKIQSVFNLG